MTSGRVIVYAFAGGGGTFVLGDRNADVGDDVTFWGAQWSKLNELSGGPAPASFKGFVSIPGPIDTTEPWRTQPGNSSRPPAGPLPRYMGVIVSSTVTKDGSVLSGDRVGIAVVEVDPGYADNPGHPGTGIVVARVR